MSAETTAQEQGKNFKLWLQELKSPEARPKALQKFYQEFEPNVKKTSKELIRKYELMGTDIYDEGVCLLLELVNSGKLEKVDADKIPAYITNHVKYRLQDYLKNYSFKHNKQGDVKDVEQEQEQGLSIPLVDIENDVRPDEKLLEQERDLSMKALSRDIGSKVNKLPPRKQQIIWRFFFEKASIRAISQELNCSPANSYKLKNRALEDLRRTITSELKKEPPDSDKIKWLN
jgi:RNA polymerase sigma factor (sigma-70 family)